MANRDEPTRDEWNVVCRRAGLTDSERTLIEVGGGELHAIARKLVVDAVREDRRWTARVKLLETRIDFAVDALRGKVELDRE